MSGCCGIHVSRARQKRCEIGLAKLTCTVHRAGVRAADIVQ
jgi:hypothetical protein